jgi:DNA-binding MarR family transcriptional regulator
VEGAARRRRATQRELGTWNQVVAFHARVVETVEKTLIDRLGISLSEYGALDALSNASRTEGLRMQSLAEAVELNQSSVSRLVARLEKQGLVRRSLDQRDRRGVFTAITEAGLKVRNEAAPLYLQTLAAAFDQACVDPKLQSFTKRLGSQ